MPGYEYIDTQNGFNIFRNKNYIPYGFYFDSYITEEQYNDIFSNLTNEISNGHDYQFVGKVGHFCPIMPGYNGGCLVRESIGKDGAKKYDAVTGTKGFRWLESETVKQLKLTDGIDRSYYDDMVDAAVHDISEYGDFEWFTSEEPYANDGSNIAPWFQAGEPFEEDDGAIFAVR